LAVSAVLPISEPATLLRCMATSMLLTGFSGASAPTAVRVVLRLSSSTNEFRAHQRRLSGSNGRAAGFLQDLRQEISMLRSFLIGLVAGSRAMTPLAAVSDAAERGLLPNRNAGLAWLGHPAVSAGLKLLAAGELWGDKLRSAPDRIVPAGILARLVTAGVAGAALAPRRRALEGAVLGATAAVGAAYVTFAIRQRAMRRFDQTSTGMIEDALTVAAAQRVVSGVPRSRLQSFPRR
jgi:uncharacterized membrane protein